MLNVFVNKIKLTSLFLWMFILVGDEPPTLLPTYKWLPMAITCWNLLQCRCCLSFGHCNSAATWALRNTATAWALYTQQQQIKTIPLPQVYTRRRHQTRNSSLTWCNKNTTQIENGNHPTNGQNERWFDKTLLHTPHHNTWIDGHRTNCCSRWS